MLSHCDIVVNLIEQKSKKQHRALGFVGELGVESLSGF